MDIEAYGHGILEVHELVVNLNVRSETCRVGSTKLHSTAGFNPPTCQAWACSFVIFQHLGILTRHHENDAFGQIRGAVADALQIVSDP